MSSFSMRRKWPDAPHARDSEEEEEEKGTHTLVGIARGSSESSETMTESTVKVGAMNWTDRPGVEGVALKRWLVDESFEEDRESSEKSEGLSESSLLFGCLIAKV